MYKLLKDLEQEGGTRKRRGTFREITLAVFWSFFGVRKMGALKADAISLTPLQLIAGGLVGCVLCVVALLLLVRHLVH